MNKKILVGIGVVIILGVAYWLLSPLWRNVTLQEELPRATNTTSIKDNFLGMAPDTKVDFEKQTIEMKNKAMNATDTMPRNQPQATVISLPAHMT
jgi:type II secretory pathway component PulM